MSAISTGNLGAINLAGSLAGTQRKDTDSDRNKAEAADRSFQIDQKATQTHSSEDVVETDLSADRDADGRYLPGERKPQPESEEPLGDEETAARAGDVSGERGRRLDLQV